MQTEGTEARHQLRRMIAWPWSHIALLLVDAMDAGRPLRLMITCVHIAPRVVAIDDCLEHAAAHESSGSSVHGCGAAGVGSRVLQR